uniref:Alpha/beta hydrolase n=1 Tax=Aplanochytrium stocchinoi TaxID=215587 RepID=A0A7S3PRP2_9STRA|mmetsp:Transcript_3570/g.4490  ORF Transcript_3570/g.4490 Transcript_3570/m.4490 type:complete len:364 (+) Transcript_3570:355-1446(+)|eukprot:CAMPEP_0204827256 /NCGR_PEP_ID=MMETSP1346-20131115/4761_1 /ASSEMBLY_ACC=CAM_ASM_000771 /TAXON_ID=215587 /ORGANISM="Aplanochytrium stocchinoi, Strain GSBS06" /LENGTH=363 /DNA_ID=CAMNT_0051955611 /DNA_START=405 /DNA_END=1496 /DNA_ORIENTATION=-
MELNAKNLTDACAKILSWHEGEESNIVSYFNNIFCSVRDNKDKITEFLKKDKNYAPNDFSKLPMLMVAGVIPNRQVRVRFDVEPFFREKEPGAISDIVHSVLKRNNVAKDAKVEESITQKSMEILREILSYIEYDLNRHYIFIVHGYSDNSVSMYDSLCRNRLVRDNDKKQTLIMIDWDDSRKLKRIKLRENRAKSLGELIGSMLSTIDLKKVKISFICHSMGSHIASNLVAKLHSEHKNKLQLLLLLNPHASSASILGKVNGRKERFSVTDLFHETIVIYSSRDKVILFSHEKDKSVSHAFKTEFNATDGWKPGKEDKVYVIDVGGNFFWLNHSAYARIPDDVKRLVDDMMSFSRTDSRSEE